MRHPHNGTGKRRKGYSDTEKTIALAAIHGAKTQSEVSRQTGIPLSTLNQWYQGIGVTPEIVESVPKARRILADCWEDIAYKYVESVADRDLSKEDLADIARTAAIATDKMLLLRGEATVINEQRRSHTLTISDKKRKIAEALGLLPPAPSPGGNEGGG